VYPILGFVIAPPAAGGVIDYQGAGRIQPHGLWENKVLLAVSPGYIGAFTVQARQIDGPNPVSWVIENSQVVPKLDLPGGVGWHYYPTSALLKGAGCYALRIEGSSFSQLIIFKAVPDRGFRELTRRRHG
jgi:hypothetical protein